MMEECRRGGGMGTSEPLGAVGGLIEACVFGRRTAEEAARRLTSG
jgi:hypothetical protein